MLSVRYGLIFKLIYKLTSRVKGLKVHLSDIPRYVIEPEGFTTMFKSTRSLVRRIQSTVSDLVLKNSRASERKLRYVPQLLRVEECQMSVTLFRNVGPRASQETMYCKSLT